MSKGYAFCMWAEEVNLDQAMGALNGMPLGDKQLTVRRANPRGSGGSSYSSAPPPSYPATGGGGYPGHAMHTPHPHATPADAGAGYGMHAHPGAGSAYGGAPGYPTAPGAPHQAAYPTHPGMGMPAQPYPQQPQAQAYPTQMQGYAQPQGYPQQMPGQQMQAPGYPQAPSAGAMQGYPQQMPAGAAAPQAAAGGGGSAGAAGQSAGAPSPVLTLSNMVTDEDLADAAVVADINMDIRGEASKHGSLLQVVIPRGGPLKGLVVLQYADASQAAAAAASLGGRSFADRTVVAEFGGLETLQQAQAYA